MNIFLIAIGIGASVAVIASISLLTIPNNKQGCTFCPSIPSPNQPIEITDITTEPTSVFIGSSFQIYTEVSNPNPYPIFVNSGCLSPLSATFDKNVEIKKGIVCLESMAQVIPPQHTVRLHGPSVGLNYNAIGIGNTTAQITLSYQAQEKTLNSTITKVIEITPVPSVPSSTEFIGLVPSNGQVSNKDTPLETIKVENANAFVTYHIDNGKVISVGAYGLRETNLVSGDTGGTSVILISLDTTSNGTLVITIQRTLIDAKANNHDDNFTVLNDGQEISYNEIGKTTSNRTLSIPYQWGTKSMEIIGYGYYNNQPPPIK